MLMNFKTASILLEVILSVFLMSIISISALYIYKDFASIHHETYENELHKIQWNNTKLFLEKNLTSLGQLQLTNQLLYFENTLLLSEVTHFVLTHKNNRFSVDLCVKNKVCKKMVILP